MNHCYFKSKLRNIFVVRIYKLKAVWHQAKDVKLYPVGYKILTAKSAAALNVMLFHTLSSTRKNNNTQQNEFSIYRTNKKRLREGFRPGVQRIKSTQPKEKRLRLYLSSLLHPLKHFPRIPERDDIKDHQSRGGLSDNNWRVISQGK